MIEGGVFSLGEDPVHHRTVTAGDAQGGVNIIVDRGGGVAALEGAEGKVVVPGDHREDAVLLIEIVIVDHRAGVAVAVDREIVDHKVADHFFDVHRGGQVRFLTKPLQRGDQPLFVGGGDVRLCTVKNGGVAAGIVVGVLELCTPAAYAPHKAADVGKIKAAGALGTAGVSAAGESTHTGKTAHTGEIKSSGHRRRAAFGAVHKAFKVEILAVAATTAHIHTVGFVKLAIACAVVALQEALLHRFYRQVKPPILPVDGDIHIAAQGCRHTEFVHHPVCQVILHHSVVLDQVIEAELVQTVIGVGVIVLIEFDLKTVSAGIHRGDGAEGGVAFAPDAHIFEGFSVDDDTAHGIFLALCGGEKAFPIVNDDVDGVDLFCVKQSGLIAHSPLCFLQSQACAHQKQRQDHHRSHRCQDTDLVNMLA